MSSAEYGVTALEGYHHFYPTSCRKTHPPRHAPCSKFSPHLPADDPALQITSPLAEEADMRCATLVLLLVVMGCGGTESPSADAVEPGVFAIETTPVLTVGVSDGDPRLMFNLVHAARRQADGTLLVADGGSLEVRWYDTEGKPVRAVGRRGEGPGEFRGPLSLLPWPGDTVAVLDHGQRRLTLFGASGEVVRTHTASPDDTIALPWRPWIARRTMVFGAAGQAEQCVRAALQAMPLHVLEEGVRFLMLDDVGRLWLQEGPETSPRISVWRQDGTPLGSVAVPASFHLMQATREFVVGRVSAEDGTERVVVLPIQDKRDAGACLPADSAAAPSELDRNLTAHARNLFVVQEAMYADGRTYAMTPNPNMISLPEGISFWMYEATPMGWVGGVIDRVAGHACVTTVGRTSLTRWPDGAIICG